jgi:hypothetical protein
MPKNGNCHLSSLEQQNELGLGNGFEMEMFREHFLHIDKAVLLIGETLDHSLGNMVELLEPVPLMVSTRT